jgi:hypothetical protein
MRLNTACARLSPQQAERRSLSAATARDAQKWIESGVCIYRPKAEKLAPKAHALLFCFCFWLWVLDKTEIKFQKKDARGRLLAGVL